MKAIQTDSRSETTMRLTHKHSGCDDGTCPAIWDTDDPETVGIQGPALVDLQALADLGSIPDHERVVLLPRGLLDSYMRSRR
jgi:hypothetical protein